MDTKIYLITFEDEKKRVLVSHGVGNSTLNNYCLPPDTVSSFKPKRDEEGLYIEVEEPRQSMGGPQ